MAINLKELSFLGAAIGGIGLCAALPGYLQNWKEYQICITQPFVGEVCRTSPYRLESPGIPNQAPSAIYLNSALFKSLAIAVASLSLPLAMYCAREQAVIFEQVELEESIARAHEMVAIDQEHQIDNEMRLRTYEAMKELEFADAVDRFNATLYESPDMEQLDAEIEEQQAKLAQAQQRRSLEFDISQAPSEEAKDIEPLSENAQKLLDYLNRKELFGEKKAKSANDIQKSGCLGALRAAEIREVIAELGKAGKVIITDDGQIYLAESQDDNDKSS